MTQGAGGPAANPGSGATLTPDDTLDLTGLCCPENSMRASLRLDEMEPGQLLAVICDDGETIEVMIPNLEAEGYTVAARERLDEDRWQVLVAVPD